METKVKDNNNKEEFKINLDGLTIDESGENICYEFSNLDEGLSAFILEYFEIKPELKNEMKIKLSIPSLSSNEEQGYHNLEPELFGELLFHKILQNFTKYINIAYRTIQNGDKKNLTKILDESLLHNFHPVQREKFLKKLSLTSYIQQNTDGKKIKFKFTLVFHSNFIWITNLVHSNSPLFEWYNHLNNFENLNTM